MDTPRTCAYSNSKDRNLPIDDDDAIGYPYSLDVDADVSDLYVLDLSPLRSLLPSFSPSPPNALHSHLF